MIIYTARKIRKRIQYKERSRTKGRTENTLSVERAEHQKTVDRSQVVTAAIP